MGKWQAKVKLLLRIKIAQIDRTPFRDTPSKKLRYVNQVYQPIQ